MDWAMLCPFAVLGEQIMFKVQGRVKVAAIAAAIGYIGFTEARVRNLESLMNTTFDSSACAAPGSSRAAHSRESGHHWRFKADTFGGA